MRCRPRPALVHDRAAHLLGTRTHLENAEYLGAGCLDEHWLTRRLQSCPPLLTNDSIALEQRNRFDVRGMWKHIHDPRAQ